MYLVLKPSKSAVKKVMSQRSAPAAPVLTHALFKEIRYLTFYPACYLLHLPQKLESKSLTSLHLLLELLIDILSSTMQLDFLRSDSFVNNKAYWLPLW